MPTVEILVNGRRHEVQCGEGEEARVRQLASYVDRRIAIWPRGSRRSAMPVAADGEPGGRRRAVATRSTRSSVCGRRSKARAAATASARPRRCSSRSPNDRSYCRAAREDLTKPARVLPGALGPRKPWGQRSLYGSCPCRGRGLGTTAPTCDSRPQRRAGTDGRGGPAPLLVVRCRLWSQKSNRIWPPLSTSSSARPPCGRSSAGEGRRLAASGDGAAEAVADRLIAGIPAARRRHRLGLLAARGRARSAPDA